MSKANNWYVLTGGPSSGKTTLLMELEKLGHATVPEAARTVIDRAVARGITPSELRRDERKFQEEVAKLKIELEETIPKTALTFFDRGMHDSVAYFRHYGYEVEAWIKQACKTANYRKVFLLEPLQMYEKDYARIEDDTFAKKIHDLLKQAYEETKMEVVSIPPFSVEERVKLILNEVKMGEPA